MFLQTIISGESTNDSTKTLVLINAYQQDLFFFKKKKKQPRYYTPEKDKRNLQKPVYSQIKNSNLPIIIQCLYFYYRPGITPDITKQK